MLARQDKGGSSDVFGEKQNLETYISKDACNRHKKLQTQCVILSYCTIGSCK